MFLILLKNNGTEKRNITEMSKKGYALVENNKKKIIKSINQVEMGEKLKILLSDGILSSKVENKIKE